ncbi:response regulator [bacterium]|nr:response regulator [bacterium]
MTEAKDTKILVVDDNAKIRALIVSILRAGGFLQITEADNGANAWNIIQENNFDLILTDFMMPEMNGLDLLKKIRSGNDEMKGTPVLMITASDKPDDIVTAAKWKVNGYILKPLRVKPFLSKINQVIQK